MNADSIKSLIKEAVREELSAINPMNSEDHLNSRKEAAQKLGICLVSLDKLINEGKLKGFRVNGRVLIKDHDLEAALTKIPVRNRQK